MTANTRATGWRKRQIEASNYVAIMEQALEALASAQNKLAPSKGSAHAFGDGELWDMYANAITSLRHALDSAEAIDAASQLTEAEKERSSVKQEPYGWAYESHGRFTCNAHPIFWKTRKAETHTEDFWEEIPLYRHPPQRQPLTDGQKYALIEKHLGLKQRRNDTVIDQYTGLFYAAKPYLDLIDEAAHGIKENT